VPSDRPYRPARLVRSDFKAGLPRSGEVGWMADVDRVGQYTRSPLCLLPILTSILGHPPVDRCLVRGEQHTRPWQVGDRSRCQAENGDRSSLRICLRRSRRHPPLAGIASLTSRTSPLSHERIAGSSSPGAGQEPLRILQGPGRWISEHRPPIPSYSPSSFLASSQGMAPCSATSASARRASSRSRRFSMASSKARSSTDTIAATPL
jgi:hypothetical protein